MRFKIPDFLSSPPLPPAEEELLSAERRSLILSMQGDRGPLLSAVTILGNDKTKGLHEEGELNVHCRLNLKDVFQVMHRSK